jgi:uncharacterized protein YjbI with pentapeptide repeats
MSDLNIKGIREGKVKNLRGADLREANLREADLRGADLREADLHWANLRGADLRGADLRGADLRGADLRGADLREADLHWADLREANLTFCKGILSFTFEKHLLIYYKHNNSHRIKAGCHDYPIEHWLEHGESIGQKQGYTKDQIDMHMAVIKLWAQYEILEGAE